MIELIKQCEKYFTVFQYRKNKLGYIESICWGMPYIKSPYWSKKRETLLVLLSILFFVICLNLSIRWLPLQLYAAGVFIFFLLFCLFTEIFYKEFAVRLFIRVFYNEWGCLLIGKKIKYVGQIGGWEYGKNYRFIISMLNIAAFCKIITFYDKINGTNRIQLITENMVELTEIDKSKKDVSWLKMIPCLISAIFEFDNLKKVSLEMQQIFHEAKFSDEEKREIECFLYGFWTEIKGYTLTPKDNVFVQNFFAQLIENN